MEKRTVTIHRNGIESFLMYVKEIVKHHKRPVLIGVVVVVLAAGLAVGGAVYYDVRSNADLVEYETLMTEYESGSRDAAAFTTAVTKLIALTEKSCFGYVHRNGHYIAGGMYFERKMYEEAKANYLKFADVSSSSSFAPLALFQAGVCAENTGKDDEALSLYKRIEKSYKDGAFSDRLFYDLGRMYQKKGDKVTAKEYYGKVIAQYPNSRPFADLAKIRLSLLGL